MWVLALHVMGQENKHHSANTNTTIEIPIKRGCHTKILSIEGGGHSEWLLFRVDGRLTFKVTLPGEWMEVGFTTG